MSLSLFSQDTRLSIDPTKPLHTDRRERPPLVVRLGIQLTILTIPLGFVISEALTVANLVQIVAIVLLLPAARSWTRNDVLLFVVIAASIPVSAAALLLIAGTPPQWFQVSFFVACVLQLFLIVRLAPFGDIKSVVRAPINLSVTIMLAVGAYDYLTTDRPYIQLFFDDKSHAAVAAFALAFLVLWANDSYLSMVASVLVIFVGIATASRLVFIGLPVLAIALLTTYLHSRRRADNAVKVFAHHLVLALIPALAVGLAMSPVAGSLLLRLDSTNAQSASSTGAHLELIMLAFQMKIANPWYLFIGVGPGGFSSAVRFEDLGLDRLAAYDPRAYTSMLEGFTPIHSATVSLITEFALVFGIAFVAFTAVLFRRLFQLREYTIAMMLAGTLVVSTFYSNHNEPFYTSVICIAALVGFQRLPSRGHPAGNHTRGEPVSAGFSVGRSVQSVSHRGIERR